MGAMRFSILFSTVFYTALGILMLVVGFRLVDWLTPVDLWGEIKSGKNMPLAVVTAAMVLAVGMIIASALH